jgi:predicted RNA methylase
MKTAWNSVFEAVGTYAPRPEVARRLTNLIIAAVLTADPDDDAEDITERALALMVAPSFQVRATRADWARLVETAADDIFIDTIDGIDFDAWVRAFQCADPARKSLGAYATPSSFADVLAEAAIPCSSDKRDIRIVDPACGAGALLVACLNRIAPQLDGYRRQAALSLFGMELDPAARELACLHIWMAAGAHDGDLKIITNNIRVGNALLFPWHKERAFDALVMNPPWESLRQKSSDPEQAGERDATVARIATQLPASHGLPKLYSMQGSGDRNLCKAFIELAPHLIKQSGRIAALIPAAFASDEGMAELRRLYLEHFSLETWTGFENRAKAFDIDSRYKFGILAGARSKSGTKDIALRAFAVEPEEVRAPHVIVDRAKLTVIGGPVGIIPEITSQQDLDILSTMLTKGVGFFADNEFGRVLYKREVDLTVGKKKGLFSRLERRSHTWNEDATLTLGSSGTFVPVVEGRMVGQYDFFQKSWVEGEGRTAVWQDNGDKPLEFCRPQYVARPMDNLQHRLAICDVTSATNTRTVHATIVPDGWICGNTAPVLRFESAQALFAGLAILNSMTFDWLARRIVSGLHLNKFYLSCMAWPNLASEDFAQLSQLGKSIAKTTPRSFVGQSGPVVEDHLDAASKVEATVARGYGLSDIDLKLMLKNDPNDRRGFWRYYQANKGSEMIARRSHEIMNNLGHIF